MTPQEYRNKHHRCKWCKYKKINYYWYECSVKDKYIPEFDWLSKWRGMFCKVYKARQ